MFPAATAMMTIMAFAVFMVMMMAGCVRIISQVSGKVVSYNFVSMSHDTGQKLDTDLLKCISGSHADAAADQSLHFCRAEESC